MTGTFGSLERTPLKLKGKSIGRSGFVGKTSFVKDVGRVKTEGTECK